MKKYKRVIYFTILLLLLWSCEKLSTKFAGIVEDDCKLELEKLIDERFKKSNVLIIEYPTINIKQIFESYFEQNPPFSSGIKKNEFPDAFALISLEEWCKTTGNKCLVLSNDKDLINYSSNKLIIIKDYEGYLDKLLKSIEARKEKASRLLKVGKLFSEQKEHFEREITDWLHEELSEDTRYNDYVNYLEIHDIEIKEMKVNLDGNILFTSVSEKLITAQVLTEISYKVEVTIDDEDDAWYDDEDKVWHYMDVKKELIEEKREFFTDFTYEIPVAGKEFAEIKIEEINEGKKLKI